MEAQQPLQTVRNTELADASRRLVVVWVSGTADSVAITRHSVVLYVTSATDSVDISSGVFVGGMPCATHVAGTIALTLPPKGGITTAVPKPIGDPVCWGGSMRLPLLPPSLCISSSCRRPRDRTMVLQRHGHRLCCFGGGRFVSLAHRHYCSTFRHLRKLWSAKGLQRSANQVRSSSVLSMSARSTAHERCATCVVLTSLCST